MSLPAIKIEGLWKQYRIGRQEPYRTLREAISNAAGRFARKRRKDTVEIHHYRDPFMWALKDLSFEIAPGEIVGVVGRNGAGKSTLLKILSQITEPTRGQVEFRGRLGSLLEVGTGFHPELTGHENVYLYGAVLGMDRWEVTRKFDQILEFAELKDFMETPVKHYSSGMYMRLAFAVAAHLEPDILLVDEVLAVGDLAFQKKCLGKMDEISKNEGRTVLFVSHNMPAVANLCTRAILLDHGQCIQDGPASDVISAYVSSSIEQAAVRVWPTRESAPGNDLCRLRSVRILTKGRADSVVPIDEPFDVEIEFLNLRPGSHLSASFHVLDAMGTYVLATASMPSATLGIDEWFGKPLPVGVFRSVCRIPGNFLNEGRYTINAVLWTDVRNIQVMEKDVVSFTVHDTGAMRKEYAGQWIGVVRPKLSWTTELVAGGGSV